jgi:4-diphosphocytidyl-2-C-methyl-D-erythritol kinase
MESMIVHAPAKINLGLEVLRKRPDGYHDIASIFLPVALYDTLTVERSRTPSCSCIPPVTGLPDQNLVYQALVRYAEAFPADQWSAKITVEKRIPTGGGLGGGSSDAASTLMALATLNERHDPASSATLHDVALSLGSDVPFFLTQSPALVEGRGEIITPLNIEAPWWVVLVLPGIHVNTALAYSTLGISGGKTQSNLVENLRKALIDNGSMQNDFTNDFERAVFAQHPALAAIKQRLLDNNATYAAMSGSGSTMYALYTSVDNAMAATSALSDLTTHVCPPAQATV